MSLRSWPLAFALMISLSGCQFSGPAPGGAQGGPPGPPGGPPAGGSSPPAPQIMAASPKNAAQYPGPPQGASRRPGTPEDILFVDADFDVSDKPDSVLKIDTPEGVVELYSYKDFKVTLTIAGETWEQPVQVDDKGHMSLNLKMPKPYTEYTTLERVEFTRPGYKPLVMENVPFVDGLIDLQALRMEKA